MDTTVNHCYGRVDRTDLGSEGKTRNKDDADISCPSEGNSVNLDWELGAQSGLRCLWFLVSSSKQSCQLQL